MTSTITTAIQLRNKELPEDESHPDTRPCPPWCWLTADNPEGYSHEISPDRITAARHDMGEPINVRASLYGAEQEGGRVVTTATLEVALEQDGADEPRFQVALRHYAREKGSNGLYSSVMHYDHDRLRLTAEDARELALVLTYLTDVADGRS